MHACGTGLCDFAQRAQTRYPNDLLRSRQWVIRRAGVPRTRRLCKVWGQDEMQGQFNRSTARLLFDTAAKTPDAGALTDRETTLSYGALAALVRKQAERLRDLGMSRGDRLAVIVDKSALVVATVFAAFDSGVVIVPVNPALKRLQIQHLLDDSGARLLVALERRAPILSEIAAGGHPVAILGDGGIDRPDGQPVTLAAPSQFPADLAGADLATLFYTSGSTGLPKAVACTHENLVTGGTCVAGYLGNTPEDVILSILPLSFDAGFSQLTTGFVAGARIVLADYLLPRDISSACARNGVTGITGVPAIWAAAVKAAWTDDARAGLRYVANTGGHLPYERIQQLRALFPAVKVVPMYGLTEAFRSSYVPHDMVDAKRGSMGRAIPCAQLFALREDGAECAPGEVGELVHSGPTVAAGYWNRPEDTARRFRTPPDALARYNPTPRVVFSGDLVRRDEDGFFYFEGRRDTQIKISGHRISFAEIEDVAMTDRTVEACVACGRPRPEGGDPSLVLFIATADGDAAARVHELLRRELPGYAVPDLVVAKGALPLNPNGKYDLKGLLDGLDAELEVQT